HIVNGFTLRIVEPECERNGRVDARSGKAEITLADRSQPRPLAAAADRSLTNQRRIGAADGCPQLRSLPRALPHPEIHFCAEPIAKPLRVGAAGKRDLREDVAIDHRDRSSVDNALNGVDEKRRLDALERKLHVVDRTAANGELALEVVAAGDAWKDLNGAQRIVGDQSAQLLQVPGLKHLR